MNQNQFTNFFKDKHGAWTIYQFPNPLLLAWLSLVVAGWLFTGLMDIMGVRLLQSSILFTWAYLELTAGANSFRKLLGATVLVAVVSSYFI